MFRSQVCDLAVAGTSLWWQHQQNLPGGSTSDHNSSDWQRPERLVTTFHMRHEMHTRALRGAGAGLNLEEFCGTGKNSKNFSIVKACAGREQDQIMGLRGGSEVKIWSRAGL